MNLIKLLLTSLFILLFISCSKKEDKQLSSVEIRFPKSIEATQVREVAAAGVGAYGLSDITDLNQIDCYAVMVSWGSDPDFPMGTCKDELSTAGISLDIFDVNVAFGSVADGNSLVADVVSGSARRINIIGFKTTLATCPDVFEIDDNMQLQMSRPSLVGYTVVDLEPGEQVVDIEINAEGSIPFTSCYDGPFGAETSGENGVWDESNWDGASWAP